MTDSSGSFFSDLPSATTATTPATTDSVATSIPPSLPGKSNKDFTTIEGIKPATDLDIPDQTTPTLPELPQINEPPSPASNNTPSPETASSFPATNMQFPSVEEMLAQLDQSGALMPELVTKTVDQLDHSPLAALQPSQLEDQSSFFAPAPPAPAAKLPSVTLASSQEETGNGFGKLLKNLGVMLGASILAAQVVQHLIQLLHFVMINYPQLQDDIMFHQASPGIINQFAVKAVWLFVLSILSLIICFFLIFNREHPKAGLFLVVASVFIATNFVTENWLIKPEFVYGNSQGFREVRSVLLAPELTPDGQLPSPSPSPTQFDIPY